ncbi:MAG: hypothetical protein WD875_02275 [Pirellulales bacterium]
MTNRRLFIAAVAALAVSLTASTASARRLQDPPPPPASPSDVAPPAAAAPVYASGCCDAAKPCCDPCIKYRHRRNRCFKCCSCDTTCATLRVKDACCCCYIDVPVCVPCCCEGKPCVSTRCGLFGRTVVEYSWDCGYRIEVTMTKRGDAVVTYFG